MLKLYVTPEIDSLELLLEDVLMVSNDGNPNDGEGTNSDLEPGQSGVVDGGGLN